MKQSKQNVFRERAQANPHCAECVCRPGSPEIYTVTRYRDNAMLAFDVDLASDICQDGRAPIEIPVEVLDAILRVNGITRDHVNHVDPSIPGIACPVDRSPEGVPVLGLIDGSHRAAKCRLNSLPFFAFHMTTEEAQRCQQTAAARACGSLELMIRNLISHGEGAHD
jgi:hypothetical protein